MKWLDRIPLPILLLVTLPLALAPFNPPHLWEKLQMLMAGDLKRMVDIFDLLLHGIPAALLLTKLLRLGRQRLTASAGR